MPKFSIDLPERIFLRTVDGKAVYAEPGSFESVLSKVTEVGIKTILTNVFNGEGKDASETERLAKLNKKLDSWARGEFAVIERGEVFYTAWKEVFIANCIAAGMTTKQADEAIRATVTERLGKDTKATFANYIEAHSLALVESGDFPDRDSARTALESYYTAEAEKAAKARAKVSAKVTVPSIDLSAFKKAAE